MLEKVNKKEKKNPVDLVVAFFWLAFQRASKTFKWSHIMFRWYLYDEEQFYVI